MIKPACLTERLFLHAATSKLPLHQAEMHRNSYGVLYFKWISPCPELEALWVSVTPSEIILSCAIAHSHISMENYFGLKKVTNRENKRRIVRDGIKQTSRFLDGQTAATITYDERGNKHSSGWCPTAQLASSLDYTRKIFGSGMTEKAWIWSGEIRIV